MRTRATFGPSEMIFEAPDTVLMTLRGDFDGDTASVMMEQLVTWSRGRPFVLLLMDLRAVGAISPAARQVLTSNGHRLPPRALALHGGSFTVRVVTNMMERASWLLGSRNRWARHWADEAAARAWLDEMRGKLTLGHRPA